MISISEKTKLKERITERFKNTESGAGNLTERERLLLNCCLNELETFTEPRLTALHTGRVEEAMERLRLLVGVCEAVKNKRQLSLVIYFDDGIYLEDNSYQILQTYDSTEDAAKEIVELMKK